MRKVIEWAEIHRRASEVAARNKHHGFESVYGVPRGGTVPAALVAAMLEVPQASEPRPGCLVVDDLVDSGKTRAEYVEAGHNFDALFTKENGDEWLVFPWEHGEETGPVDAVRRLLQFIGENPDRDGLLDTPNRVLRAYRELTEGYAVDVPALLATTFEQDDGEAYGGIIVSRNIPFTSLCEHHMLPFTGVAHVAYIPGEGRRIVGLSKLARTVEAFAKRLQVQERMTMQIASAIESALSPEGVAVVVEARHACQEMRGVRKTGSTMVTSEMRGAFLETPAARAEVLDLFQR